MLVKYKMTQPVQSISPDASIKEAAERMRIFNIGVLPVCEHNRVVGILTDRDIAIRSTAEGHDPQRDQVRYIMSSNVECCYEAQSLETVAQKMEKRQIHRLPVLNPDHSLVGILSVSDLAVRGNTQIACEVFEKISEPAHV